VSCSKAGRRSSSSAVVWVSRHAKAVFNEDTLSQWSSSGGGEMCLGRLINLQIGVWFEPVTFMLLGKLISQRSGRRKYLHRTYPRWLTSPGQLSRHGASRTAPPVKPFPLSLSNLLFRHRFLTSRMYTSIVNAKITMEFQSETERSTVNTLRSR